MKKLFTLFAAAALCMSASAKEVVDAEVDFSKETAVKLYSWGGNFKTVDGVRVQDVDLKDGCFHFCSTDTIDPGWACQFFPFGNIPVEADIEYTVTYEVKGTPAAEGLSLFIEGLAEYGTFSFTEDFQVKSFTFTPTKDGPVNIQVQCGSFIGEWWIKYFKVTHEKDDSAIEIDLDIPVEEVNFVNENGGADAEFDQSINFEDFDKFPSVCAWGKEAKGDPHPAFVEDGAFVVHATAMESDPWDNQFWICAPMMLNAGDSFHLSFKYKASANASVATQAHCNPSNYSHWAMLGNISFTTDWQTYDSDITLDSSQAPAGKGFYSIAFNLNDYADANDYYIDDIVISGTAVLVEEKSGIFVATDVNPAPVEVTEEKELGDEGSFPAITVGTEEAPVAGVWIATKTGSVDLFKANSVKLKAEEEYFEDFGEYTLGKGSPITLPEAGIWTIYFDEEYIRFVQESGSSIESVNAEAKKTVVYNLAGQRVEKANGLVVKNGKVVFVK